jgi:hypothetical protein
MFFSDWNALEQVACGVFVTLFGGAIVKLIAVASKIGKKGGGTGR